MEVAHHDHTTHAVVGGIEMKDFGIADTAQFFTVLSKTLYTNEKLAVVREIICNAWDAHIAAGRTDTPIEIILNNQELIIRDYGPGIHHDNMHQTYFVYGLSNKLDDDTQTGGFGLGSKAPFAYTDHFTVTSMHKGTKTVYNLSKASGEKGGKPRPRVIVQLPTDESGLIVQVPIQEQKDVRTFETYIRSIVSMGEINATLNEQPLQTFPISTAMRGMYFMKIPSHFPDNTFFIRVGSVVYPIGDHETYNTEYEFLLKNFKEILGRYHQTGLLLQAPPGKISVAPNRESLSMSKMTQLTIKDMLMDVILFSDFNRNPEFKIRLAQYMADAFSKATATGGDKGAICRNNPLQFIQYHVNGLKLREGSTFDQLIAMYLQNPSAPLVSYIHEIFWKHFRKTFTQPFTIYFPDNFSKRQRKDDVFAQGIYRRAIRAGLNPKRLHLLTSHGKMEDRLESLMEIPTTTISHFQEIVTKKVVCFHTKLAALRYHRLHPFGSTVISYITDRTKEEMDRAMTFFKSMGWEPVDFTAEYNGHYKTPSAPRQPKPKVDPTELPLMSNLLRGGKVNRRGHVDHMPVMGTAYKAVVLLNGIGVKNNFPTTLTDFVGWNDCHTLIEVFGNDVALAPTEPKYKAMLAAGKVNGEQYMTRIICQKAQAVPGYLQKLAMLKYANDGYRYDDSKARKFMANMHLFPASIVKDIPTLEQISEADHKWLTLYIQVIKNLGNLKHWFGKEPEFVQAEADYKAYIGFESTPTITTIKELLRRPEFDLIDFDDVVGILARKGDPKNPVPVKLAIFAEMILLMAFSD